MVHKNRVADDEARARIEAGKEHLPNVGDPRVEQDLLVDAHKMGHRIELQENLTLHQLILECGKILNLKIMEK